MSKVKRYNPELEKDIGLGLPCLSMLGNPYGEWVHYQDYAELKAQRDALAAESAALMDANDLALDILCDDNTFVATEWKSSTAKVRVETPATDAYLNSVRADAVASFAHHHRVLADSEKDSTIQRGHRITACRAEDFAAQLRAGEPS